MQRDLELLDADLLGAEAPAPPGAGTSAWKWALGGLAAVALGYFALRDLPPADLFPRRVPPGARPW